MTRGESDTIVAIATAAGRGGIGVIRLSGPSALVTAAEICRLNPLPRPGMVKLAGFYDAEGAQIDEGLLLTFCAPHSFTGEDVAELHAHGAPVVLDLLVAACCKFTGVRIARPGEFSERAFLNGKIDLTRAEAIADLINSSSTTAAKMAVRSLTGEFANCINTCNEKITWLRVYIEAALDFPDEDLDLLQDGQIAERLSEVCTIITEIFRAARSGSVLREGLMAVILGRPNAGKSTLINRLARREVAIVTDIAGTTRDILRETVLLGNLELQLLDTAGLQASNDIVEQEGIKRALNELQHADCILHVIDAANNDNTSIEAILREINPDLAAYAEQIPVITIFNKIDSIDEVARREHNNVYLSARLGDGLPLLEQCLYDLAGFNPSESHFLARRRHIIALEAALLYLTNAEQQLTAARLELVAEDLRLAHHELMTITGEFSTDDLLGQIFSSFCIGK